MSHKSSFIVCLLLLGVLAPVCHAYLFNHPSYHHHHRGLDDLLSFGRAHNPYESLSRRPQPRYECPPPLKHQRLHISETDEAYVLKVTLPGVHKRDISVDIDGTTLKLKALRMPQSGCEYNGGRYDAYGRFLPNAEEWREVVQLPVYHLPTELVSASFQHQQLVITVHKPGVAREVAPVAATAAASPTAAAASPTAPAAPASPGKAEAYTAAGPHSASPASAASRPTQRAASSSPPQHNAQQQHQHQRQQQQQQRQQQQHQRQQQHQQQHQRKQQDTQKPLDFSWDSFERILSKFLVYVTPGTTSTTTASSTAASSSTDYDPDVFSGTDPRFYSIPVENTEAKPDSDSALVEDAPIQLDLLLH